MYCQLGKIGLLVPGVNTTMERDFWRLVPDGVTVHSARFRSGQEGTREALLEMERGALEAADILSECSPDVVIFGCTSGSFIDGVDGDRRIKVALEEVCRCPVFTTSQAMVLALKELKVRRLGVVTPYVEATNTALRAYLERSGFEVVALTGLGMLNLASHAAVPWERIEHEIARVRAEEVEGVFVACTQLAVLDHIEAAERVAGLPIVSAVQASGWVALGAIGVRVPVPGYGRLFEHAALAGSPQ